MYKYGMHTVNWIVFFGQSVYSRHSPIYERYYKSRVLLDLEFPIR